jgi:site-specific recombinase XerD
LSRLPNNPLLTFIEYRKAMGITDNSIDYYKERLGKAFIELGNPYHITSEEIISYLNTIPPNKLGLSTRHASWRTLKTFYRWLHTNYSFINLMEKVPAPDITSVEKAILPTLSLEQLKKLIQMEPTMKGKAIIATAAATGLRLRELTQIQIEHIDWQSKRIWTKGKGQKEGYAIIGFAEPYLRAWLKESRKESGSVFDFSWMGLQTWFRRLGQRTGMKTNAHTFKRSFAFILKELGMDIEQIRILGRWEKIDMPIRYTKAFTFDNASKLLNEKVTGLTNLLTPK